MVKNLNEMAGVRCFNPGGAFYLLPHIGDTGLDSVRFAKFLLEKGSVVSVPGSGFGPYGEGHVRLCFAQSMEELEKAIDRIGRVVAELAG